MLSLSPPLRRTVHSIPSWRLSLLLTMCSSCHAAYNFDHPDSFDTEEMVNCLESLKVGAA